MTTKPSIAVFAAISSAVLIFGNTAHAKSPTIIQSYAPNYSAAEQIAITAADSTTSVAEESAPTTPTPTPIPSMADKVEQLEEPQAIATYTEPAVKSPPVTSDGSNTYVWGQCTWYAKSKRPDLPNGLGNGGRWVANAAARGFATGSTPRAGAIGEQPGHVVYVESVNSDGTVNISEMNYNGGVGVVHYRTVAASTFTYIY